MCMPMPMHMPMYMWLQVSPDIPTMDDRLRPPESSDTSYQFVTNTSASASALAPELLTCYQILEFLVRVMHSVRVRDRIRDRIS